MAKMDPDFQEKIDALERKFEVVSVIFQKYLKVFCDIFTKPEPTAKTTRHRAARKPQRLDMLSHFFDSTIINTLETNCALLMKSLVLDGPSMFTSKVTTSFLLVNNKDLTALCIYTGKYPAIADDLVNSHHLLLCCVDTLYTAVVSLGNREDLLNDTFIGTHV